MPKFGMAEQYGLPCSDLSNGAWLQRAQQNCPFLAGPCVKKGGVCSITDGESYPIVCPHRFKEADLLYRTVAEYAFGTRENCVAIGEVPFLKSIKGEGISPGKIDNIIVLLKDGEIEDWCGLEVQAVYFSGASMTSEIRNFEETKKLQPAGNRRPDFRSSGPKRLLPQLEIKVPTLRRWGKKMFVAIDKPFFEWLPAMESANDFSNADICWLGFGLETNQNPYKLVVSHHVFTTLEESRISLVAGKAPPKQEFEEVIAQKIRRGPIWPRED